MKENEYLAEIKLILQAGKNPYQVFSICEEMVSLYGRDGGLLAYKLVNEIFDSGVSADAEDAILDVLDALTGYCANPIGTGNYHLK